MASDPPGNYVDNTVDHAWDARGSWYFVAMYISHGGGTQVWKYVGEGRGSEGTGWVRVLHVPPPDGYYTHGFSYALHVGKIKVMCRNEFKTEVNGYDIPGAVRFAAMGPM